MSHADARIVLIDNYDSFTFNLVQAFRVLDAEVVVHRNDAVTVEQVLSIEPTHIVISPGPGRPESAGISVDLIRCAAPDLPLLGVCLGFQALAQAFGGRIVQASRLMHGKRSLVRHDEDGLFRGVESPTVVGRYHSLAVSREHLPADLIATAIAEDGEIMAVRHESRPLFGVQFHPESVLTPEGPALLANFLRESAEPAPEASL